MAETDGVDGGWLRALTDATQLAPGTMQRVGLLGRGVLLCNVGGTIFAVADRCTHATVPLAGGRLRGCLLECPRHGGKFDVRDGRVAAPPPSLPLRSYPVRVVAGRVEVRLER